ncbi:lipopolysaccharide assembly protein LapA domain-containing protein [Marinimicrobium sp. LS-A18]|uniref:lipopolysaccharide assembly protein LapA domain-containing protein n=1 Tax=Marinimicrobium sp. LS-A18 TaxID=1381596 RepID=UPI0004B5C86B|nr:lipopolysaccharide assembly protein LapA domain-containing protein [Marinimicrobium sp. LS-A18]
MKPLLRWIKVALLVLAFLLGVWFALENAQAVPVTLMGLGLPSLSLGVWLLIFTALGTLLGMAVSLPPVLRLRRQLRARERQLARCEKELKQLRLQPIRD